MHQISVIESPVQGSNSRASEWGVLPPVGDLDAYIRAIGRMPMLTHEEELEFSRLHRESGDVDAAGKLVLSHLRLVGAIARQYHGYGLPLEDLIQEGNLGLMKAVKRFDPDQGVRLVSYATPWIRAEMVEFVIKNWRIVKIVATKPQRKLFFNLRSMKQKLLESGGQTHRDSLQSDQAEFIAKCLGVKVSEVLEMESRLSGADMPLDPLAADDGEPGYGIAMRLSNDDHEPAAVLESLRVNDLSTNGLRQAMDALDERSRYIVEQRWINVNDDSSGGMTLHDLAVIYGVSPERIRQIEVAAMKKMKKFLVEYA